MTGLWREYASKFDALSQRERLMVAIAALAAVVYAMFALGIDPALQRARALQTRIAQQRAELDTLHASLRSARGAEPADAALAARQAELRNQIATAEQSIRDIQASLVPADRMNGLLQALVSRESGLQLVALHTLPPAPLIATENKDAAASPKDAGQRAPGIYKHGVEVTLRGQYAAIYRYLARLENSGSRMYWWEAQLSSDGPPQLTMKIVIYTLSTDRAWLQV